MNVHLIYPFIMNLP